jgi:hypothetical protein
MRKFAATLTAVAFAGCGLFGGSGGTGPLAGWAGEWTGSFFGSGGDVGMLELEFSTDTMGAPVGVARFDAGGGIQESRLQDLMLTWDSLTTALYFDGMSAEIRGARKADQAEGVYVLRPTGEGQVIDSGTWELARNAAGG